MKPDRSSLFFTPTAFIAALMANNLDPHPIVSYVDFDHLS